jgi:hypothetical protein
MLFVRQLADINRTITKGNSQILEGLCTTTGETIIRHFFTSGDIFVIDLDLNTLSTDELTSLQKKINKELEKRSGGDIKRLRTQMGKLAKGLRLLLSTDEP